MPARNPEGFQDFGIILSTHRPVEVIKVEIHTDGDSTTVTKDLSVSECLKGICNSMCSFLTKRYVLFVFQCVLTNMINWLLCLYYVSNLR